MNNLRLLTAVYGLGLGCGIFSIRETIEFCDMAIEKLDKPPIQVIEASMMSGAKIDDIEGKLAEFHQTGNTEDVVKVVLSIINFKYKSKDIDIKQAVRCSSRLLMHTGLSYEREYYELYNIEDAYDLAENHVHYDLSDVVDAFNDSISQYDMYFNDYQNAIANIKDE